MKKKDFISSLIFLILFVAAYLYSRGFPAIPKMIPGIVCGAGAIFSAALLIKSLTRPCTEEEKGDGVDKKKARLLATAIAALVSYVLLIKVIGFYVTSFAFMIGFSWLIEPGRSWWQYPVVAAGTLLVIYLLFSVFLHTPLPQGILF